MTAPVMKLAASRLWRLWGRRRAPQLAADYREVFQPDTPYGKRVLADLAEYCHAGVSSFTPGDSHGTAFAEGRRDVFNHIAATLGLTPADFPALLNEVRDE